MKNKKRNNFNWLRIMAFLLLATIFLFGSKQVFAETDSASTTVDFVLVIDCSGSMLDNDQDGLTINAAKYFISQLPTRNTRLAIIAFGEDYGEDCYDIGSSDLCSRGRVKLAYDLNEISSEEERNRAQEAIDSIASSTGDYTPMGYAVEAAVRVLDSGNAKEGKAAIILISDGQVDGQTDSYNGGLDFYSIDSATNHAQTWKWPIYCMELNYKGENRKGDGFPGIAYHQMRENIPKKTGTEPIELQKADQAKEEMLKVLNKFFDPDSKIIPIEGEEEQTITIKDLVAEQNINILGDVSKVTSVELVAPDGTRNIFENTTEVVSMEDKVAGFDKPSSAYVKLIMPQEGDWKITVHTNEEANLSFDMVSIAFREMNLNLSASNESGDIARGTEVQFSAKFNYQDKKYESDQFYAKTDAYLVIGGTRPDRVKMETDGSMYKASYVFDNHGSYSAHVSIESPLLPEGKKESEEVYNYTIEAKETTTKGEIPKVTMKIRDEALPIDMTDYFDSPDGDPLVYSATIEKQEWGGDLSCYIDKDGKLSLTAGERCGDYVVRVGACDGKGEKEVYQHVSVEIQNSRMQLLGDGKTVNIRLSASGKDEYVLYFEDYFHDADKTPPIIRIYDTSQLEKNTSGKVKQPEESCVDIIQEKDRIRLTGIKAGETDITVQAVDGNDPNTWELLSLHVDVETAQAAALNRFKIPLIILGVILLCALGVLVVSFVGRKIYGKWKVSFPDGSQADYPDNGNGNYVSDEDEADAFEISRLRHCKGSSVTVDSILKDIDRRGGFGPKVKLVAGDKRSRTVYLEGIDALDGCEIDGDSYEGKGKKVVFRKNSEIVLKNEKKDLIIRIERYL